MRCEVYDNIREYSNEIMDILADAEIENNLMISICLQGIAGADATNWFMGVVRDKNGTIQLAAAATPPHNLLLYSASHVQSDYVQAIKILVKEMANRQITVPGVMAQNTLAETFAEQYASALGKVKKEDKKMRIYRLDQLNGLSLPNGHFRTAEESEIYFLPYWQNGFNTDCGFEQTELDRAADNVKKLVADKKLWLWEDGKPVSQAAATRETLNGAIVSYVYTPPFYRGKGYATGCVASLSKHLLDQGYKFCTLFADLDNPYSNRIYMNIGYKPVCDVNEYKLEDI